MCHYCTSISCGQAIVGLRVEAGWYWWLTYCWSTSSISFLSFYQMLLQLFPVQSHPVVIGEPICPAKISFPSSVEFRWVIVKGPWSCRPGAVSVLSFLLFFSVWTRWWRQALGRAEPRMILRKWGRNTQNREYNECWLRSHQISYQQAAPFCFIYTSEIQGQTNASTHGPEQMIGVLFSWETVLSSAMHGAEIPGAASQAGAPVSISKHMPLITPSFTSNFASSAI